MWKDSPHVNRTDCKSTPSSSPTLLARAALAPMLADARPPTLLAPAALAPMLALSTLALSTLSILLALALLPRSCHHCLARRHCCRHRLALRLGRLVASSPRDASTSLPLLSVLSSLGRKQRWWRCCSQGLRGRVGRSETTGGYVARLWGRGHMLPHFRSAQLTPTAPHRGPRPPRHGADLPGPGFPTRIPRNGFGQRCEENSQLKRTDA